MSSAHSGRRTPCGVVPPYVLESMVLRGGPQVAEQARRTLQADQAIRAQRQRLRPERSPQPEGPSTQYPTVPPVEPPTATPPGALGSSTESAESRAPLAGPPPSGPDRTVGDAAGTRDLPGTTVRGEGDPATGDAAVDEAYDGLGDTWTFYDAVLGRDSIDGRGMPLIATVHYGQAYDNAFWNGSQMVFGDGDGEVFTRFTASLDVIGHELTHGVTETTAGLVYQDQPGALNESISDVFGSLVKQRALDQTSAEADWLIGSELVLPSVHGVALRSMKAPGTAYDDPVLGRDPQPDHMDRYVHTTADNGGVHINSGIPNHAFYLTATGIGGRAWETAGLIWWDVLTGPITPRCDFATFARLTMSAAVTRFGPESPEAAAVASAWDRVGLGASPAATPRGGSDLVGSRALVPPEHAALRVRRSGGVAGIMRDRTVVLGELPRADTDQWQTLVGSGALEEAASRGAHEPPRPDAFSYRLTCPEAGIDVEISEQHLPGAVVELIERTLRT